jgi:hypothetical protein
MPADEKLTAFGKLECAIRRVKAQGGFVITPPRWSKTLGGNRGPKLSASYRDDGETDCPVPAVALLEAAPWFVAVGVWHAPKTAAIAQTM